MESLVIDLPAIIKATLMFVRITTLLFALPFFGDSVVSAQVRVLTGVALAIGLYPLLPVGWGANAAGGGLGLVMLIVREIIVGLIIGYLGKLMFEGLIMASSLVGYQMGFGTASLLMPGMDAQVTPFTALHRIIVLLVFLSLGLHYIFIHAMVETFRFIPAGGGVMHSFLGERIIALTSFIFTIALQLAAPILVALLFTMAALGVIARTVPQLNVFTLSFPFSFFVGLIVYVGMTPFLPAWLQAYYLQQAKGLLAAVQSFAP